MKTSTNFPTRKELLGEVESRRTHENKMRKVFKLLASKIETEIGKVIGPDTPMSCYIHYNKFRPVNTELYFRVLDKDLSRSAKNTLDSIARYQIAPIEVSIPAKTFPGLEMYDEATYSLNVWVLVPGKEDAQYKVVKDKTWELCFECYL